MARLFSKFIAFPKCRGILDRVESTPITLLERLRRTGDQEAWARFVRLYTPLLFFWSRRCGLRQEDAADLTQEVFATLVQKLPEFTYDRSKSFRSWLRTVTLNHWRDRNRRLANRPIPGNDVYLNDLPAPDFAKLLDEQEYRQHLVNRALHIMQTDFQPLTWKAFWEHGVRGRAAAEVAAELDLSLTAVYGAKFRVLARLRQELDGFLT